MTLEVAKPIFVGSRMWNRAAHRQRMPLDVPAGPRKGELANVLATRLRSGETIVEVTWAVEGQVNLSFRRLSYSSPRMALDAGWELGPRYEEDAARMERMEQIYGAPVAHAK